MDKRVGTHVDTRVAWHEKKGPQSHGNSRMTFTEWLDNKEALERTRPTSPQAARNEQHRDGVGHERHLQTAKKYEEWLQKKDQEALEQEEMLRKRATRKFHRTYKKKWQSEAGIYRYHEGMRGLAPRLKSQAYYTLTLDGLPVIYSAVNLF